MTVTIEQLTINFDGRVILLGGLLIIVIIWLVGDKILYKFDYHI